MSGQGSAGNVIAALCSFFYSRFRSIASGAIADGNLHVYFLPQFCGGFY